MKKKSKIEQINEMYQDVGYRKKFIVLFALIIVTALIDIVTVPYVVKQILDVQIPEQNIKGLIILAGVHILIILAECYMVLKHCEMRCFLSIWIKRDLRNRIFNKLQKVKAQFFDSHESGLVLQFLQEDTENAGRFFPITITEMFVMGLVRFFIVSIFLLFVNIKIGSLILLLYVIGLLVTVWFNRKTMAEVVAIRNINREVYTTINEGIQNVLTIKTLGIIKEKVKKLEDELNKYNAKNSKLEKIISMYNAVFSFITGFSSIAIIYLGGMNVIQGIMTYAEIMLMIDYADSVKFEFSWFTSHLTDFNECFLAYAKILELLEEAEEEDLTTGEKLTEKIRRIEFDKVSFSYTNTKKNIKNFSLQVEENEKVALIGRTGARKDNRYEFIRKVIRTTKGRNTNQSKRLSSI